MNRLRSPRSAWVAVSATSRFRSTSTSSRPRVASRVSASRSVRMAWPSVSARADRVAVSSTSRESRTAWSVLASTFSRRASTAASARSRSTRRLSSVLSRSLAAWVIGPLRVRRDLVVPRWRPRRRAGAPLI